MTGDPELASGANIRSARLRQVAILAAMLAVSASVDQALRNDNKESAVKLPVCPKYFALNLMPGMFGVKTV